MWYMHFNRQLILIKLWIVNQRVTTFTHKVLVSTILYFILDLEISTCIINNFQIKILPKLWSLLNTCCSLVLQDIDSDMEFSIWDFFCGCPWDQHLWNQEGQGRGKNQAGMLARLPWLTPLGTLGLRCLIRVVLPWASDQDFIPPPCLVIAYRFPLKDWWLKVAHQQHFQQLGNRSLKGDLGSTSPCSS